MRNEKKKNNQFQHSYRFMHRTKKKKHQTNNNIFSIYNVTAHKFKATFEVLVGIAKKRKKKQQHTQQSTSLRCNKT